MCVSKWGENEERTQVDYLQLLTGGQKGCRSFSRRLFLLYFSHQDLLRVFWPLSDGVHEVSFLWESLSLSPYHDRSSPAVVIIARVMHAFIVFSYLFSYIRLKPGLLQVLHKLHWVSIANQFDWTFSFWETSRNEVHFFFFFVLISSSRQTTTVSAFTSPLMPLFPSSLIGCSSPW